MSQPTLENTQPMLGDPARLEAISSLELVDILPEEAFDRLTRLASRLLPSPVSLISIVEEHRQFFTSAVGLDEPWASARQTPLSHSFCQYVVASGKPLIIEDAREHPILKDNLAIPELGVVSYLGMPLTLESGHTLGSFCVIDTEAREWTKDDIEVMQELAQSVITEIELRREVNLLKASERKRETLMEALRQSESYLQSVVNAQNLLIVRTDLDGNYTYVNDVMLRYFSWMYDSEEDMLGTFSPLTVIEEDWDKMHETTLACMENPGQPKQAVLRNPLADGGHFWGLWEFTAIMDRAGEVTEIQCVGINFTDHQLAAERQFELALEKERVEVITQFIAEAAHEFRTPLSIINSNAYLMAKTEDKAQRQHKEKSTNRQVARLTKLVDSLSLLVQVENAQQEEQAEVDVNGVVRQALTKAQGKAVKSHEWTIDFDDSTPKVTGHEEQLSILVEQLIDNAIRFTPDGGSIRVKTGQTEQAAWVEISDTGPGIKLGEQKNIFNVLWRQDETHTTPGFGLGLPIAARIAKAHHGEIEVSTDAGEGAIFRVLFPLRVPS